MNFRHDINGLRAIAVIAVVLFHFQVPGFSAGFLGVDVFFVISGFLMAGILLRRLDKNPSRGGLFSCYGTSTSLARGESCQHCWFWCWCCWRSVGGYCQAQTIGSWPFMRVLLSRSYQISAFGKKPVISILPPMKNGCCILGHSQSNGSFI